MKQTLALLFITVLFLIILPGLLSAQQIPKQPVEKFMLPNGMQVLLREEHRTPTVNVDLVFHAGSGCEKPGETGFAHLFEHMMFQGTENLPGDYVARSLEFGGSSGGWTSKDFTSFSDYIPSNYLERILWMQSDRLANINNTIKQERLDVQRDVVKNERREFQDNTPYSRMGEVMNQTAYPPDHPYSWETVGRMEDLDHVTLETLKNFFRRYYSPDNATLVLYGDFVSADAKALIYKYFASIPPGPGIIRLNQWIPYLSDTKKVTIQDNINMPRIDIQWPMPARFSLEEPAAIMLCWCLTSDASARLTNLLVEKTGLVVSVGAYSSRDELAGEFHIILNMRDMKDAPLVEHLIDSVLADIAIQGVTESELEGVKNRYLSYFIDRLQSDISVIFSMFEYNFRLGDPDKFQWDIDRYLRVTPEDVIAFAARYLDKKPRVILACVPRGDLAADTAVVDYKNLPKPGPESEFVPPGIQRATLSNSLQLLLVENHTMPLVSAQVFIRNGWSQDPENRWGLSTMTQALIDEETTTKSKIQIAADMRRAGATIYTGESSDGTTLSVDVLKTEFERSMATMADIIMHPAFSQVELDKKKTKFLNVMSNQRFDPEALAKNALYQTYFGKTCAYAQPDPGFGVADAIKSFTREELREFYRSHYSPEATAVIIAGDLTLEEAKAKVEKALGKWKAEPQAEYRPAPAVSLTGTKVVLVDQPDATQSLLYFGIPGLPGKHPDYMRSNVPLLVLVGSGPSDRVNKVIREEKGYSYGILGSDCDDRYQTLHLIAGNVQSEHTAESVQEIVKIMAGDRHSKTDYGARAADGAKSNGKPLSQSV